MSHYCESHLNHAASVEAAPAILNVVFNHASGRRHVLSLPARFMCTSGYAPHA